MLSKNKIKFIRSLQQKKIRNETKCFVVEGRKGIEELLKETPGRFALVITSAKRAKDINSYFNQLGEGIGAYTPPQVQSLSRKPLTVAFEEIAAGKVEVSDND